MPDAASREEFATWYDNRDGRPGNLTDFTPRQLAELTAGLNLVNMERLLAGAGHSGQKLDAQALKRLKKRLIERQAQGMLEFVEPKQRLDDVVGHEAVKKRLLDDAAVLIKGRLDAVPMGYLFCGPVGTGKTFLAECFAGSIGIPCVMLKNFRSKYVGETEGNLEQFLSVCGRWGRSWWSSTRPTRCSAIAKRRRLGHVAPGVLHDRRADGRHSLSRQDGVDAADRSPRLAADRSEAPGPRRGPHPAVLSPPTRPRSAS